MAGKGALYQAYQIVYTSAMMIVVVSNTHLATDEKEIGAPI